jgi:1-deoxy-D-xylulose-5-phosphate synthase
MLTAEVAASSWRIEVINMRFIKPLDADTIARVNNTRNILVTLEEHALMGGAGSAVNELVLAQCANAGIRAPCLLNIAIEDQFIAHQTHAEQLYAAGLTAPQISKRIVKLIDNNRG